MFLLIYNSDLKERDREREKASWQHGIWIMMKELYSVCGHPFIHAANIFECLLMFRCSEYQKKC